MSVKRLLFGLLLLVLPGAAAAAPLDEAAVDRLVRSALEAWEVPGIAVAVVRDGQVVYLKGHGVRELGRKDPVTPDTLFPIASCTKAFTTAAMGILVDEGKMSWDDPVRKHLDYFHLSDPAADALVTLRDLVTHRTGVRGHELLWYRSPWSQEEVIRRIGHVKLDGPFRSSFQYQSTMFTAAGHAVASAAKMPWAEFVQQRLLDPLGMKHVTLTTPPAEAAPDHASPHRMNHFGQLDVIPWYRMDVPDPAGSVNASARDLCQWVRFQLGDGTFEGKRLLSAASLGETHMPQNIVRLEGTARAMNPDTTQLSYGMGWVIQDYRGQLVWSHAGAIDGFRAQLTLVPAAHLGIVTLSNRHQSRMNLALSWNLVDLLLGLPHRDWDQFYQAEVRQEEADMEAKLREREAKRVHQTQPARELAAYTGTYEEPAYGEAKVTLENGLLVLHWSTFTCPLIHFHYDTFTVQNSLLGNPQVQFVLGRDGEVTTMKAYDIFGVDFKKVTGGSGR